MSHVLYGSVKITSYDRVADGTADVAADGSGGGGGGGGSDSSRGGSSRSWFGGSFLGSAAAAMVQPQQQQQQLASLRSSTWYSAPHTSRLMATMANFHELEAGRDGEPQAGQAPCHRRLDI